MSEPSLDDLLRRIAERKANAKYLEFLFQSGQVQAPLVAAHVNALDPTEQAAFVDAVFDHYMPFSWPLALTLFQIKDQLRGSIWDLIRQRFSTSIQSNREALTERIARCADDIRDLEADHADGYELLRRLSEAQDQLEQRRADLAKAQAGVAVQQTVLQELETVTTELEALRRSSSDLDQRQAELAQGLMASLAADGSGSDPSPPADVDALLQAARTHCGARQSEVDALQSTVSDLEQQLDEASRLEQRRNTLAGLSEQLQGRQDRLHQQLERLRPLMDYWRETGPLELPAKVEQEISDINQLLGPATDPHSLEARVIALRRQLRPYTGGSH